MKKKIICKFIIFLFLIIPISTYALDYPKTNSKIVEIYDLEDDKLIYDIDSNKVTSIASLTKIATTIVSIESIKDLDEKVTITNSILDTVRWDASKAGLKAGDKLTYRDLLYASMLPSGADATNALAILSSGSIDSFVEKMNALATKLELKNTHFVNVTGLDAEGHYSTADDVRKLLSYSLKNELFRKIYTTKEYTLSNGLTVYSTLKRYNNNNNDISNILGSKTGYTGEAGYCLASLANINSHEFIVIVLNADINENKFYHIIDTIQLINFLLDNYKDQILIEKNSLVKTIPIKLSKTNNYKIYSKKDIKMYLPSDYDKSKIKIEYNGIEELSFMNKENEKIGTITYYYDNKVISKEEVLLNTKIEISIKKIIKEYLYLFIIIPIIIIFIILKFIRKDKRKRVRRR